MISLLIFGLIASAYAAPNAIPSWHPYRHGNHHHGQSRFLSQYHHHSQLDSNNYFDTNKFWADFNKEMKNLNDMLTEFSQHFPTIVSQDSVVGNEYRITIPLSGFEVKDIIVKARKGFLMIQAHHKNSEGNENNYLNVRALPATVTVNGKWNYDGSVLKIMFPLKEGVETQTVESVSVISTDPTTEIPKLDRENVDQTHLEDPVNSQDADVGLNRGDVDTEVKTDEFDDRNTVEATTYAVDLQNEVEFVPIKY
ncbi:unnamed protein product [Arctia plantaginis]|uniref:Uncharacterized protein n=1 Tax=Arctia plantaginis TaxID=874455 RepID=A0A8S1BCT8_ARCPL|nr:unnamed protein product [Arctia plantaginis]